MLRNANHSSFSAYDQQPQALAPNIVTPSNGVLRTDRRQLPAAGQAGMAPGFTLVELLVVIGIIGILAALLLPALGKGKQRAQGTQCLSNMKQLQLAAIIYGGDNNDYLPANVTVRNGGDNLSGNPSAKPQIPPGPNWVDGTFSSKPPWNGDIAENPVGYGPLQSNTALASSRRKRSSLLRDVRTTSGRRSTKERRRRG